MVTLLHHRSNGIYQYTFGIGCCAMVKATLWWINIFYTVLDLRVDAFLPRLYYGENTTSCFVVDVL